MNNISPEIRFTSPANGQFIAQGTFQIQLGLAFTDDRELAVNSDALRVYFNDRELNVSSGGSGIGGDAVLEQAYRSIYDSIESTYSVELADQFGNSDSAFANTAFVNVEVPSGFYDDNETVTLTAEITDSDGAVGRHSIEFIAAPDDILPEIAINAPVPGFAAIETSDFTIALQAYDNVKVDSVSVFTTYGTTSQNGEYVFGDYGEPVSYTHLTLPTNREV